MLRKTAPTAAQTVSEAELRARLAELEDIYRHAPVGLCVLDRELRWLRVNEYLARRNGFPVEAHLGRRLRDLLPGLADLIEPALRRVLATGEAAVGVELVAATGGEERAWEVSWLPVRASDGSVEAVNVVAADVSERRRDERALHQANQRLRALMDAVPVGVSFSDDPTCRRITGNPAVFAQFDGEPHENLSASAVDPDALGRRVRFYRDGQPLSDDELPLQRAVRENAVVPPFEIEVEMPGGRRWFCEASGAPVRNAAGEVIGGISVTVDVTERRRIEADLRRLNEELRASNEVKDLSLAAISHELRNPLSAIASAVHILKVACEELPAPAERALGIIQRQTTQLARLADDLIDLQGVTRGRLALRSDRIDLGQVAARAVEDHRPAFEAKGLALSLRVDGAAPVRGDAARLGQVVGNLLHNASKFTSPGRGVRVAVEVGRWHALLRVADEGRGLSGGMAQRIFEPFVQDVDSDTPHAGGLGLGLAIVRRLVEQHGGTVLAHSDGRDRGTEFVVTLPLADRDSARER